MEQAGITHVLRAMQLHPSDADVQVDACFALELLARNNEEIQELIVDSKGISLIVDTMRRHESVARVQHTACLVLWTVAANDARR